jgi:hypothetical protein
LSTNFKNEKMKQMKRIIVFSIAIVAFTAATFAQVSATANATATIITPLAITRTAQMDFGSLFVSTTPGTVVINPVTSTRSATGGCTLVGATVSPATFTVTGLPAAVYTISLPASAIITDGTNNLTVDVFTSDPTPTGTLTAGTSTLRVGATLNVPASQTPGIYTSAAAFTVTVNYQ